MKYIFEIVNVPWYNSTVDVWPEGEPENKTRLLVLNFRSPAGIHQEKLIEVLKIRFSLEEVEVEQAS